MTTSGTPARAAPTRTAESTPGGSPGPTAERTPWRPRLWRELLVGLAAFAVYTLVAAFDSKRTAMAAGNGRAVFDLERRLRLDVERTLNHWLAPHEVLRTIANYDYAISYVLSALALLTWLYLCHPEAYRWARTSFVLLNLVGIACFASFPVMPPRMLPDLGFIDTVRVGHTWGSWGSPLVSHANQLAAMPSLHVAWALWVSVVLARLRAGRLVQLISAVHVLLTTFVIMATANHYLLDAVAGAALVWACVALVAPVSGPGTGQSRTGPARVAAADAFFLHIESPAAPQHIDGVVIMDTAGRPRGTPTAADLAAAIRTNLDALPRFRQRLSGLSRWRRPHWVDVAELDWAWHVPEYDLSGPDGRPAGEPALHAFIAGLLAQRLPMDRPMWRFAMIHGFAPDRACAVLLLHHVVADGVGAVVQSFNFLEPRYAFPMPDQSAQPGALRSAAAIAIGLAQLATDGRPSGPLPTSTGERGRSRSPAEAGTPNSSPAAEGDGEPAPRRFGTVTLPLAEVRAAARGHGARVTDVLLCAIAGGLSRVLHAPKASAPQSGAAQAGPPEVPPRLRVSVTLMVRAPGSATEGNATAAVLMDLPLGPQPERERLADIAAHSRRLRTGTRALASRFVMQTVGGLLPPPAHAWFARTVYGGRFFHAIVSNMPGPDVQLTLAGAPMLEVYPVLPLAPGAPLTVGALGWNGLLCVGIAMDPALVADPAELSAAIRAACAELADAARVTARPRPAGSEPTPGRA